MTEGKHYRVTFSPFIRVLGLDRHDANRSKIHNHPPLPNDEMKFMYLRRETENVGKMTGLYTYYSILNRLLRKIISQKGGNPQDISLHAKNLLARLRPKGEDRILVLQITYGRRSSIFLKTHKRSVDMHLI